MIKKPLRINAKSLSDALAPSKKIAWAAGGQRRRQFLDRILAHRWATLREIREFFLWFNTLQNDVFE